MCQDCGFDPGSEHIQEPTNECMSKWNKMMCGSLKINKLKEREVQV